MSGESDERDEDELEDGEIQDEDYDDEEEDESRSSFRFSLNNPFNKNKKIKDFVEANSKPKIIVNAPVIIATSFGLLNLSARKPVIG